MCSVALAAPAPTTRPAGTRGGGNKLHWTPNDVHALLIDNIPESAAAAAAVGDAGKGSGSFLRTYTSREIRPRFPFNDLVPSWNIDVPEGSGFAVEIRVHRQGGEWTPYYYLGSWGAAPKLEKKLTRDENAVIHTDYLQSQNLFDGIQYRVTFAASDPARPAVLHRFAMAYSNTLNDADLARKFREKVDPGPKEKWTRRLPVPFRTQATTDPKLKGQNCSPTSVSMVMEYYGVNRTMPEVCYRIWDPEYRLFGNWWRAVEGAWTFGVPGYIERFGDWDAVKRHIARGEPVIASIQAAPGEVRGARWKFTDGHLIVVTGFDENGDVYVNDPDARKPEDGMLTYARDGMEKAWLAHGGVGYILEKPVAGRNHSGVQAEAAHR